MARRGGGGPKVSKPRPLSGDGPWLETRDEGPNPQKLALWLDLNGVRTQTGNSKTMVFSVAKLVSYVSQLFTLMPGDVIYVINCERVYLKSAAWLLSLIHTSETTRRYARSYAVFCLKKNRLKTYTKY